MGRMAWATPVVISIAAIHFAAEAARGQVVERPGVVGDAAAVEAVAETGFVVLDGTYVAPPYVVRATAEGLTINGRAVRSPLPEPSWGGGRGAGRGGGRFGGGRFGGGRFGRDDGEGGRGPGRMMDPARRIVRRLENGSVLVAFDGHPAVFLSPGRQQNEFFEAVRTRDPETDAFRSLLRGLPSDADRDAWSNWLAGIDPSDELWKHADEAVRAGEAMTEANRHGIAASRRLDGLAYPLTVAGMVLGVLALGHLLRSFPQTTEGGENPTVREIFVRATVISVGLVVALSALDLVWTLLAAQAGQMRELNPLASQWIDDPQRLLAFKAAATLVGCGLLFALRRHPRAQVAAWWLCLVCTVLTFRWVVFNSMFIA